MYTTPNMGLNAWDQGSDPYDHDQLASNFGVIDTHDHSSGKGIQINTAGIVNSAITADKIANGAITSSKIGDNAVDSRVLADNSVDSLAIIDLQVGTSELADGSVTYQKLAPGIFPRGMIAPWWRSESAVPVPQGWALCDGTAWSLLVPNAMGLGGTELTTGTIPDLRNKFILGAAEVGTGTDPASAPSLGSVGGSHTRNFLHTHTSTDHFHNVNDHWHGIVSDGAHRHRWPTTLWNSNYTSPIGSYLVDGRQRGTAVAYAQGHLESFFIGDLNRYQYYGEEVNAPMETIAAHSHGGYTSGYSGAATTGANVLTMSSSLSDGTDLRPGFIGLLYIMRIE